MSCAGHLSRRQLIFPICLQRSLFQIQTKGFSAEWYLHSAYHLLLWKGLNFKCDLFDALFIKHCLKHKASTKSKNIRSFANQSAALQLWILCQLFGCKSCKSLYCRKQREERRASLRVPGRSSSPRCLTPSWGEGLDLLSVYTNFN